jgi:hypothetical protein
MTYIIIGIIVILLINIFKRYFPVSGVNCIHWTRHDSDTVDVIDLRDYNESYRDPIREAMNLPIAYLNRHYKEIPKGTLHVIASNRLEKNIGIRFFRKKGFQVVGYTLIDNNKIVNKVNKMNVKRYC